MMLKQVEISSTFWEPHVSARSQQSVDARNVRAQITRPQHKQHWQPTQHLWPSKGCLFCSIRFSCSNISVQHGGLVRSGEEGWHTLFSRLVLMRALAPLGMVPSTLYHRHILSVLNQFISPLDSHSSLVFLSSSRDMTISSVLLFLLIFLAFSSSVLPCFAKVFGKSRSPSVLCHLWKPLNLSCSRKGDPALGRHCITPLSHRSYK